MTQSAFLFCPSCRDYTDCQLTDDAIWHCEPKGHYWPYQFHDLLGSACIRLINRAMSSHDCGAGTACCLPDIRWAVRKAWPEVAEEVV